MLLLELGLVDAPHVADDVGGDRSVGIGPDGFAADRHPREVLGVLGDDDLQLLRHVDGDRDGFEGVVLRVLEAAFERRDLRRAAAGGQLLGDAQQHLVAAARVVELVRAHGDDQRRAVVDDDPTFTVEDPAPRRLLVDEPLRVGDRHLLELLRRHHLQVPEPGEQGAEERHDDDPEDAHAQPWRVGVHRSGAGSRWAVGRDRPRPRAPPR
ncbi:MAG: hypothetical protein R2699_17280 [Acidimicrobiales bacterium]